jgi:hypothetical protein
MRRHCVISLLRTQQKWFWHTELQPGEVISQCEAGFASFSDCVSDAHAHGYNHVEVPYLDARPPTPAGPAAPLPS